MKNSKFSSKPVGILSSSELKTAKGKMLYWIFFGILLICSIVAIIPTVWTFFTAVKDSREILEPTFFPSDLSFRKIVERISESWNVLQLGRPVINTMVVAIGAISTKIIVCGFAGYAISKLKPKGSALLFVLIVWTMMLPGQIRMVTNYMTYLHFPFAGDNGLGMNMLDTYWPFFLGAAADCYSILLFKNSFDGISRSLVEAAKIDGSSNLGILLKIMFPLSVPMIIFVSVNCFTGIWSDYMTPLLYLDKNKTVPLVLFMKQNDNAQMNDMFMGYIFATIPCVLVFAIFQKYILGGVNVGGVKE